METIQRGVHRRKLFSCIDVNTFTVAEAITRFAIMVTCQIALLLISPMAISNRPAYFLFWTVLKTLSAYFLVGGDVEQLVKGLMNYLAFIYAYITAQTLFRVAIAEAQEYDGDCVIVAISTILNICPSHASQFENPQIRTRIIIKNVRRHLRRATGRRYRSGTPIEQCDLHLVANYFKCVLIVHCRSESWPYWSLVQCHGAQWWF